MREKVLNIAVIGINRWGEGNRYAETILNTKNMALTAICDINPEYVNERASFYGLENDRVYTDYRKLLERSDTDAVCVVTNDNVHKEIAVAALKAGKHVLCEKPMALKVCDCLEMIEAEKESGCRIMVGQVCRFTPSFCLAKRIVDEGVIGKIYYVESEYTHRYHNNGKTWRECDPDRNVVIGGGCHAVDLLRWFAGNPTEITAFGNRMVNDKWFYDDCTIANMKFESGAIGKVMVAGSSSRKSSMRTAFYGSEGTIITDKHLPYISLYKKNFMGVENFCDIPMHDIEMKLPVRINSHNIVDELKYFADKILHGGEIEIGGIEGCNTIVTCDAIVKAAQTGRKIRPHYY